MAHVLNHRINPVPFPQKLNYPDIPIYRTNYSKNYLSIYTVVKMGPLPQRGKHAPSVHFKIKSIPLFYE